MSENHNEEYEDICYICRRTESKAGKMVHLPNDICVCSECMQRTFDSMNNGNIDYENIMKNMPFIPNMGMINFSDFSNLTGNAKPNSKKVKKKITQNAIYLFMFANLPKAKQNISFPYMVPDYGDLFGDM